MLVLKNNSPADMRFEVCVEHCILHLQENIMLYNFAKICVKLALIRSKHTVFRQRSMCASSLVKVQKIT